MHDEARNPLTATGHTLSFDASNSNTTPLQQAIKARALDTLENAERQPKSTLQRKIGVGVLVVIMLVSLVMLIDFGVRVMHNIIEVWYGAPAPTKMQPPKPLGPDEPFYITVEPPVDEASSSSTAPPSR